MLLLVDYSSILYRAFHSTPSTVSMHGVHGCLNMMSRILLDRRPDKLVMAVDDDWRPQFRVDALPCYKAHRVAEEPDPVGPHEKLGREILEAMGIAVVGAPGYEAEDIIATLAARTTEDVSILSGDRDLFALVRDPQVHVLYPLRGTSDLLKVDEAEIVRRYGIPGRAYGDFALLRGDPSDGLPGVPGIGEKTAARLISQYGSLEALLAATDVPAAVARKLDAAHDYLAAARRVVLPVTDVPLPEVGDMRLPRTFKDSVRVEDMAVQYNLHNAITRLKTVLAG